MDVLKFSLEEDIERTGESVLQKEPGVTAIHCSADGGKLMQCYRDKDDVYFPFEKFLKNRFELSGKVVKDPQTQKNYFEWYTSSARVKTPNISSYDPFGPFGHFAYYSVETRDRVRCINAQKGVPMSTQWSSEPYFYPVQIAQYALQHFSRFKTNTALDSLALGEDVDQWTISAESSIVKSLDIYSQEPYMNIISKGTEMGLQWLISANSYGVKIGLSSATSMMTVTFSWKPSSTASFAIFAYVPQSKSVYELHYVRKDDSRCVWSEDNNVFNTFSYFLRSFKRWHIVNRNFMVDLDRALVTKVKKRKPGPVLHPAYLVVLTSLGDVEGLWVSFSGNCFVKDVRQRSSSNLDNFLVAAEWFLKNQNDAGGWSVPVSRTVGGTHLSLPAGWHSAMAQGHALSVLVRAFGLLNDSVYLDVAGKALDVFEKAASDGGVSNELFGHTWYEEYPTVPGTYVLNGFMYSLIGLYDFASTPSKFASRAKNLFDKGSRLVTYILGLFFLPNFFLSLYDTGSGSVYDLRHFTLKTAPNVARWDYHAVHVYLLKWIYGITNVKYFDEVADRWIGYSRGRRAKHN
ncbi:unnamed protein product [Enterobius vermicularis]|uniref:heparosan-N-sulfate-glucuronate 5-epimerase n=1 Tax=Enterobius vermicularis TaxID=51028 RepID=A0A0N4V6P3_ENTVE|nr:unnamed protein product [Enterobius vermicularis]